MPEEFPSRLDAIAALTAPGEFYHCEEQNINGVPCRVMQNAPATLRHLLEHAQQFGELDYLVFGEERLTYSEAYSQIGRLAHSLVNDFGVKKGDRVAIGMRNYPEWIISFWAITAVGGIAVALNALWTGEELAYALDLTDCQLVVVDRERAERLQAQQAKTPCTLITVRCPEITGENVTSFPKLVANNSSLPECDISTEDDAIIFFTSGSTGHPKGVVSSHRAVIHGIMSWDLDVGVVCHRFDVERPDEPWTTRFRLLVAVPLFHVSGAHVAMIGGVYRGRELHLMYKWDALQAVEVIEREQITHFLAVSSMTGDLVKTAEREGRSLASLAQVGGGGSPRPSKQVQDIDRVFKKAAPNTGWGMTETNAIGAGVAGRDYLQRPASSGQASAWLDLQIRDDEDRILSDGETGHLLIRGTSMFRGYWNRPDANAEAFIDGWFRTGDIAYIDEEGFLFIVDRAKDIVIRGGENVGCGEVEDAIYTHSAVNEVVVFGLPHERLIEEVVCMIALKPETTLTKEELHAHLATQLAAFQIPSQVFFTDESLPRIASGKFNKRGIRQQLLDELGLNEKA